ncbi:uncharacterized protein C2845_PM15G10290 [Panicum miliaceum]|uniref:Uncharacterized protein n=1 Tax=Panicum miliaceum TaxID=4540 RepID=A0A3L6Q3Z6_PANMI|nr:uncharacterized protein C2845_PM15G10290 [Panicum miliaceum]
MIFQSLCLGILPLLDAVGGLVASLRSSVALPSPTHGGQFAHVLGDEGTEAKSSHAAEDGSDPLDLWQLWTLDLLDTSHVHADPVSPCACSVAGAAPSSQRSQAKQRREAASGGRSSRDGGEARAAPDVRRGGGHAAGRGRRRGAARAGDAVLVLVNTCGVLGSALAAREFGREAMCAISGVLIVFCQVAVPAIMGAAHAGLSGGGARMAGGHAAGMFALACAVSGGFSWAWGALFWAATGAALGFGLGFAQMQCFLLTLRQLKHAAVAYYAVWIWS